MYKKYNINEAIDEVFEKITFDTSPQRRKKCMEWINSMQKHLEKLLDAYGIDRSKYEK